MLVDMESADRHSQHCFGGIIPYGPIVFANVKLASGQNLVEGKKITGFTNGEENAVSKYEVVSEPSGPGSCEDLLSARGATFSDGGVFQPNVVVDGKCLDLDVH